MFGLIISVALALLLVGSALLAMRRGELEIGERKLERGQVAFWVITAGGMAAGVAIATVSVLAYWEVHQEKNAPPQVFEREGVSVTVPATWRPLPELEELMGRGARYVLAVGGDGAELLVLWPPSSAAPDAGPELARDAWAEALKSPALAYERWEVVEEGDGLRIDAAYPSPRGPVRARHLVFLDGETVRVVTATCNTEGDFAVCEEVIASVRRTGAR